MILSLLESRRTVTQILQIHGHLITTGLISDQFIASRLLVAVTSNSPKTNHPDLIFNQIHEPNIFIYNTMIKWYSSTTNPQKSLLFYRKMRRIGVLGDNYTYPYVVKACGTICRDFEGRQVHCEIVKVGFEWDVFVRNGLISMYCKCGAISCSSELFYGFKEKDLVSWNMMLGGFVGCGEIGEAQKMFDEMPERDVASWSIMIDGYGKKLGDVNRARELFNAMPLRDIITWNSMATAYVKVGNMFDARQLLDKMHSKNVISYSIIIDGYVKHGSPKEAIDLFKEMLIQGTKPDKICIVGAISSCAQLGALDQGRWIQTYAKKNNIKLDLVAQTALIDMYMKCGSINEAKSIFHSMSKRNVVTWNVMIGGLGMNGREQEALRYFSQMEEEGIKMDDLVFLTALSACSHAGFVSEGLNVFDKMKTHLINPKLEHYGCLIDILGRAGNLDKALMVIESMEMSPNSELWGSLLLACRTHKNVGLAEIVVEKLVELESDDAWVYVQLSNIYADAEIWEGVSRVRRVMSERKIKKETGKSVIEVNGSIEEFVSGKKAELGEEIEGVVLNLLKVEVLEDYVS